MRDMKFRTFPSYCNVALPVQEDVGPFPRDILLYIFSFIKYYTLNRLIGVNRTWHKLITSNDKYWKEVYQTLTFQPATQTTKWRVFALTYHCLSKPRWSSHSAQKKFLNLINKGKEEEARKLLHKGLFFYFFPPDKLEECMKKIKLPGLLGDLVVALNNALVYLSSISVYQSS